MAVTIQEVDHIAALARLEFTAAEKEKLVHQLNDILSYMKKLNELDTSQVEPLAQVIELENVFREDVVRPSADREAMLRNAPHRSEEYFKVPKVIGDR